MNAGKVLDSDGKRGPASRDGQSLGGLKAAVLEAATRTASQTLPDHTCLSLWTPPLPPSPTTTTTTAIATTKNEADETKKCEEVGLTNERGDQPGGANIQGGAEHLQNHKESTFGQVGSGLPKKKKKIVCMNVSH